MILIYNNASIHGPLRETKIYRCQQSLRSHCAFTEWNKTPLQVQLLRARAALYYVAKLEMISIHSLLLCLIRWCFAINVRTGCFFGFMTRNNAMALCGLEKDDRLYRTYLMKKMLYNTLRWWPRSWHLKMISLISALFGRGDGANNYHARLVRLPATSVYILHINLCPDCQ